MRNVVLWLALLVAAAGIVWLLQGINVLPGSFMTGDPFWAWTGLAWEWPRSPGAASPACDAGYLLADPTGKT